MLDEMMQAGYTGTELGPYGFFPTDPATLGQQLAKRNLKLLGSFVPVVLSNPSSEQVAVEHITRVGGLLATLKAPFLVMADAQSPERNQICGRVPADGSASLNAIQWKNVAKMVAESARVAHELVLDLVFHPHVATYNETPDEIERFFDVTSSSNVGLCLDTGHSVYGGGDRLAEARKYAALLRLVHIKDVNKAVLAEARRRGLTFEEAIAEKVFAVVGKGCIDFSSFFRVLTQNGYSGWIVVEQDVKFGATEIPPAQSVAASLKHLQNALRRTTAVAVAE